MTYNLVYLIGNGFDIKMGLHTRYEEFYQWYKSLPESDNPTVQTFRDAIRLPSEEPLWSDLEWAIGNKYLSSISNTDDAKAIFKDVQAALQKYIKIQDDNFSCNDYSNVPKYISWYFEPYLAFRLSSRKKITHLYDCHNNNVNIKFAIFNYTSTLEKLIGWKDKPMQFSFGDGMKKYISEVEHVHGYCDGRGRLALGVDNPGQIANPLFSTDQSIIDRFVKPAYNDTFELEHHSKCLQWIVGADVIVVFGMSLGKTDESWWKAICSRMIQSSRCILIVHFKRDCSFEGNGGPEYQEQVRLEKQNIVDTIGIKKFIKYDPKNEDSRQALKDITDRIFPTFSSEFLSLPTSNQ